MQRPDRAVYTPTDFTTWKAGDQLVLTPKFQRRGVWSSAARSYFVDTILRQMPIPPIYIRVSQSPAKDKIIREVIDGQQRISAVIDFIEGKYPLSKSLANPWAGKTFDKITTAQQDTIRTFGFSSEVFHGVSDLEVLEVFERLNTYSVQLNAQELRNGKYFGQFKQSVYALAREHLEFWRKHKILTERNIARMLEAEFVSEVVIAFLDGMQDKKKTITGFYAKHDEKFALKALMEKRFREVADTVNEAFPDDLKETEFRRPPLAYTLFCVIYHRKHGLKGINLPTPRKPITRPEMILLNDAAHRLSERIEDGRAKEPVPEIYVTFVAACLTQTDNIRPRQERFKALYNAAFK